MQIPLRTATLAMAVFVLGLTGAAAQTAVEAHRDWSVFEAGDAGSKVCWIVTRPTASRATRGGQTVQVRRGDIFLMVAERPGAGVTSEVSFLAGYPFKPGSTVSIRIGGSTFTLQTDGENAWTPSPAEDAKLVAAMRRGANAQATGESSRGTETRDTFSLLGFTAALTASKKRCG